jgi:hypothetical protein
MPRTVGESEMLFVDRYRELYWQHNEYQIIGTPWADAQARKIAATMAKIVETLGYTPAA